MNQKHLQRLIGAMYAVQDFPVLDAYGSKIFWRPVRGTWKLFRHIVRTAVADVWQWSSCKELASYPKEAEVPVFEEFATLMLHEATHGWCYFLKNDPSPQDYPTGIDEERVCWDVSKLACEMLGIPYQKELADLSYQFYHSMRAGDTEEVESILEKLPSHLRS